MIISPACISPLFQNGATLNPFQQLIDSDRVKAAFVYDKNLITQDADNVMSIWWDKKKGKTNLGVEENLGNTIAFGIYKITATEANHFNTGCAVGDVFIKGTSVALDANNKVQRFLGNHIGQPIAGWGAVDDNDGVIFNNTRFKTAPFTFAQPEIIYLLMKQITWNSAGVFIDGRNNNSGFVIQAGSTPGLKLFGGSAYSAENTNMPIGEYHIVRAVIKNSSPILQIDDLTATSGTNIGSSAMGGISMGSNELAQYFANVKVKEAIFLDSDVAGDREIIYKHFRDTYYDKSMNLIACSGQSNSIGYYPEDILPTNYNGTQDKISIRFEALTGAKFVRMNPAVNCGYDLIASPHDKTGWAAEQSCSHDLLESTGNEVYVVKSGFNGGAISEWDAGKAPYTQLENGLKSALNNSNLVTYNKMSVLWAQGEADCILNSTTDYYETKLRSIISRLRASDTRLANIQIVMLKLSDLQNSYTSDQRLRINTAFANIAANTANTVVLNSDSITGISVRADGGHYTAASQLLIGSAWKNLIP